MLPAEHAHRRIVDESDVQEIGYEEHHAALLRDVGEEAGGVGHLGAHAARRREQELADHPQKMFASAAGGHPLLESLGESQEPDAVMAAHRGHRKQRGHLRGEIAFALIDRSEPRRCGDVDRQQDVELAVLAELLDERRAHPRRDVPVDAADVIARLVLAHLFELEPRPTEDASVRPEQRFVGEDARLDLDLADAPEHVRWKGLIALHGVVSACRRDHGQGSGTLSSTFAMTDSGVISSASAW